MKPANDLLPQGEHTNHYTTNIVVTNRRLNILLKEKLYIGFIHPILKYGRIVRDNYILHESELLESVQLEAARIITGLRKGTSHAKLYTELEWVPLKERRRQGVKLSYIPIFFLYFQDFTIFPIFA